MFKQILALTLAVMLVQLTGSAIVIARTPTEKDARFVEKVKAGVAKLGTGKDALVKVKLRNGTKLSGYIRETNDNSFVVVDAKTGEATTVPYPQVKQAKGNNLSGGAWFAIGVGVIVAVVVVVLVASKGH